MAAREHLEPPTDATPLTQWRAATATWSRAQRVAMVAAALAFVLLLAANPLLWWLAPPARTRASVPAPAWSWQAFASGAWMRDFERHAKESSWLTFHGRGWRNEVLLRAGLSDSPLVTVGRDGWMFLRSSVAFDAAALARTQERRRAVMAAAVAWAREQGVLLLAVPAPDKSTLYPEYLPDGALPPGRAAVYDTMLADLAAAGVPAIDVRAVLQAAKLAQPERLLYLQRDTHWTQVARAEVAAAVARRLASERPELRLPASDITVHPPFPAPLLGDLAHLLGVRLLADATPESAPASLRWLAETGTMRYATIGEGATLAVAPVSPPGAQVALCGSSYSTGLAEELADALRTPVDARGVQPGGQSFRGLRTVMAAFGRDGFAPRVVVWEFVERDYLGEWLVVQALR
jgi:hypothetical protein